MSNKKRHPPQPVPTSVIARDFIMKLAGTGQIVLIGLLILLGYAIRRTPEQQIPLVWIALGKLLDRRSALGYFLWGLTAAGWFVQFRISRSKWETEMRGIAASRTAAQQKHFKRPLSSSRAEREMQT